MKNNISTFTGISLLLLGSIAVIAQPDPVKKANESNEVKSDKGIVDDEVAEFLVKSADARMMDIKEGRLATTKATSAELKEYGTLMVKDQSILLDEIKLLSVKLNITLPTDISDKKREGQIDLSKESGKEFDDTFIKMMKIDHERDVRLFEKATKFKDKSVSDFAKKYLPLIQSHLDKIDLIRKER